MTALFELDDVTVSFGGRRRATLALDHLSLQLAANARIGIVGESGSGKTTLLKLLAGLIVPTMGTLRFRGQVLDQRSPQLMSDLRRQVAMVFQDPRSSLDPRMRVAAIVGEPLLAKAQRSVFPTALSRRRRVDEVLQAVDLPTAAGRLYPHEFSGGERQRIAIARALAGAPSILLADEPVSALDVSVRSQVLNLLNRLTDDLGFSLLLVTHDLSVVRHSCDQLVVMRAGRLVEVGGSSQVLSNPMTDYTRALIAATPRLSLQSKL
ncbi:MAG: ATP-binding cassette domain-containing protein [Propionibacteriaceae bacterium]|jgi:peptide/nickel transport system ATP-binding protein|nr:ATP-binding cassette domain-containing protein [Propionibacteriaceae bacterium]